MKVTYTATNRAHHYPYAEGLSRMGCLQAFVTAFSRLSPRSALAIPKCEIKRADLWQTLYLASLRLPLASISSPILNRFSNKYIDQCSYQHASKSNVFLYYRTTGRNTTRRLKAENKSVSCVMEEVNSHVEVCHQLMQSEYESLGFGSYNYRFPDHDERLAAYDEADYILCPSEWVVRSFISKGLPPSKILKNPYAAPLSSKANAEDLVGNDEDFRILFVGQIHFRKGLRYLIEAFRKLRHPRKKLIIVGPKTSVTGLERTTIPDGVTFTGALKGSHLKHEYRCANVFCLPSVEEGLALVMGEALSHGLPVVATSHSGAEDLFTDNSEGFIVPPCNPTALAEALQMLADDRQLRPQFSEAAINRAKSLGGWDASVQNLVTTLKKVSHA